MIHDGIGDLDSDSDVHLVIPGLDIVELCDACKPIGAASAGSSDNKVRGNLGLFALFVCKSDSFNLTVLGDNRVRMGAFKECKALDRLKVLIHCFKYFV